MDPRTVFEGVIALIVSPARAAVPRSLCWQPGAATLGFCVPVDIHVFEGNINRPAEAVVLTGIERGFLYHHEVHMVPSAHAGIVYVSNFHALPNVDAPNLDALRDAVFGDVQVDLVGPGIGSAVFEGNAVGAAGVSVVAGVAPVVDVSAFRGCQFKHRPICKIKCVGAVVTWGARGMPHRPGQTFCQASTPGEFVAAVNGAAGSCLWIGFEVKTVGDFIVPKICCQE